jgi:hypothetical protein
MRGNNMNLFTDTLDGLAHEIWQQRSSQLLPNEGIVDGADRIKKILEEAVEISVQHQKSEIASPC